MSLTSNGTRSGRGGEPNNRGKKINNGELERKAQHGSLAWLTDWFVRRWKLVNTSRPRFQCTHHFFFFPTETPCRFCYKNMFYRVLTIQIVVIVFFFKYFFSILRHVSKRFLVINPKKYFVNNLNGTHNLFNLRNYHTRYYGLIITIKNNQ